MENSTVPFSVQKWFEERQWQLDEHRVKREQKLKETLQEKQKRVQIMNF